MMIMMVMSMMMEVVFFMTKVVMSVFIFASIGAFNDKCYHHHQEDYISEDHLINAIDEVNEN